MIMEKEVVEVFIVDDHPVVRRGLGQYIDSREGFHVCGDAADANTAIVEINRHAPQVVIVDINLKGINGIDLIKAIRNRHRSIYILVLSMHDENEYVERAMRAGARGYVLKSDSEDVIIDAINHIMNDKIFLSSSIRDNMLESIIWHSTEEKEKSVALLTDREFEIFELIGKGLNTREIAVALSLSSSTVGTYRERIKSKLDIHSPNELIRYAVQWVLGENKA